MEQRMKTLNSPYSLQLEANGRFPRAIISIAVCAIFTLTAGSFYTSTWAQTPPGANRDVNGVTLNFVNAEIADVARTMGVMTGRNIVVDPRVKGTMNLSSDKSLTVTSAYKQFLVALRLQGFVMVDVNDITKLVPEADAKLQGGTVTTSESKGSGNQILTQIFRLNYETANNLVAILRPLISPNNTINVNPGNNSLVITDYADNMQRLARIIAALDVSNATDLEVIPLKHALASDLVPLLVRLSDAGGAGAAQGQADTSFKTAILAEPRSNAIIVRASNSARVNLIKSLIDKLDQPTARGGAGPGNGDAGNIYVVYLKNADAVKMATTLRAAIASSGGGGGGGGLSSSPVSAPTPQGAAGGAGAAATPVQASAGPSTGGQIQADPSTNALIITAPEPQYRQLRAVIDKLDSRRAQVYIESLIVEVNANNKADFGIQWQGLLASSNNGTGAVFGTNFGTNNIISNSVAIGTNNAAGVKLGEGFNLGILPRIAGKYTLGFVANLLQKDGDANILSTPNLLTLDNEEAKIVIGRNVPFVTGQFTNTNSGGNGAVNPFQTIERKDVGITLRVKPQISENGSIKMQIFQEVSSVESDTGTGLITKKRSIDSNVVVDDGSIVVIGGLIEDSYSGSVQKVPGLGDVPFFGNLFKNQTRTRDKTNLMVFIRPVVVRDSGQTEAISLDRYDFMRAGQKDAQPKPSSVLNINEAPVLPPLTPVIPLKKDLLQTKPPAIPQPTAPEQAK